MKNELILITRQFPYGTSETFLESEIKVLSEYFTSVIIYPSTRAKTCRNIPANVSISDDINRLYCFDIRLIFKSLISLMTYRAFFQYGKKIKNIASIKGLAKYVLSYNIYDSVAKVLFGRHPHGIFYSYWFSPVVDALVKHKTKDHKLVCRVHRGDLYEEFSALGYFPFRNQIILQIDKIYSISQDGISYLKGRYTISNVMLSRLGIFDNHSINISDSSVLSIVSVSNVISVKRVDLIARVVQQLAYSNAKRSIQWHHFGDGNELPRVKKIIEAIDLGNLTTHFHGRVLNNDIYKFYSTTPVSLFINLSESEGIPVSIMEAISFGIPILAMDVGANLEIVNPITGLLLPRSATVTDIVKGIESITNINKNRAQIRNFWRENYNADINYVEFAKDLLNLVS